MASKKDSAKKTVSKRTTSINKRKVAKKTTTSQSLAKKSTSKRITPVAIPVTEIPASSDNSQMSSRKFVFNKTIFVPLIVILIFILLYVFRGNIFVATVNNQPIWAGTFYNELKKDAGQQAMSDLVTKTLILQEAQRKHVTASDAEINQQVKQLQTQFSQQGQNLDDLLKQKNMTMSDLQDQIKVKLLIQKILGNSIKVSDNEVSDYLDKNKDSLPQGASTESARAYAKQQLESQKLQEKFQALVMQLQKNAKINYYISY